MRHPAKPFQGKTFYEFDGFRVDPLNRLLLRDGEAVPLAAKVFDILLVLLEHRHRLLAKEEVMQAVWPDSFVEEGNLTRNISTLRKALGERPDEHRYIVTVPGRGYRFVAEVAEVREGGVAVLVREQAASITIIEEATEAATERAPGWLEAGAAAPARSGGRRWAGRKSVVALAAAGVVLTGVVAALIYFRAAGKPARSAAAPAVKSLAVLPFKPLDAGHRDPVYELGMADTLILKLSTVREVEVRPTRAIRNYADLDYDPVAAGREQQVDYVLSASFQRAGDKLRVTAQLINVGDESVAEVFKCDALCTDIFGTQDVIAEKVAGLLLAKLSADQRKQLARRHTTSEEAYYLYHSGWYHWYKFDTENVRKGRDYFEQAIAKDPDYALAYTGLATAYLVLGARAGANRRAYQLKANEAALKALALDDTVVQADVHLGHNACTYEWDWVKAEHFLKHALELDPDDVEANNIYSVYLVRAGRLEEGIARQRRACELAPREPVMRWALGWRLFQARRYDEATAELRKTLEMNPDLPGTLYYIWRAYEEAGKSAEAFSALRELMAAEEEKGVAALVEKTYATSGYGKAREVYLEKRLDRLQRGIEKGEGDLTDVAITYARLGRVNEAFRWLDKAYESRSFGLVNLKVSPDFDPLRADPRFQDLLQRIGFPQ